jgi:hypothetical protein
MEPKLANISGFYCTKCREATCMSLTHLVKCFNKFTFVVFLLITAGKTKIFAILLNKQ